MGSVKYTIHEYYYLKCIIMLMGINHVLVLLTPKLLHCIEVGNWSQRVCSNKMPLVAELVTNRLLQLPKVCILLFLPPRAVVKLLKKTNSCIEPDQCSAYGLFSESENAQKWHIKLSLVLLLFTFSTAILD